MIYFKLDSPHLSFNLIINNFVTYRLKHLQIDFASEKNLQYHTDIIPT